MCLFVCVDIVFVIWVFNELIVVKLDLDLDWYILCN